MSAELVQLVQKGYDAWNKGDRGWVLEHMSPDVRWITPADDPDPGTYEGLRGVERYWAQWRAAVGQLNFRIEEIMDAGQAVVVVARRQGRGEHSGLEISDRVIQVFHFDENAKCIVVHEYYDRDAALSAVRRERPKEAADRAAEPR
jgi:ketosteroid isomerase-like protein